MRSRYTTSVGDRFLNLLARYTRNHQYTHMSEAVTPTTRQHTCTHATTLPTCLFLTMVMLYMVLKAGAITGEAGARLGADEAHATLVVLALLSNLTPALERVHNGASHQGSHNQRHPYCQHNPSPSLSAST